MKTPKIVALPRHYDPLERLRELERLLEVAEGLRPELLAASVEAHQKLITHDRDAILLREEVRCVRASIPRLAPDLINRLAEYDLEKSPVIAPVQNFRDETPPPPVIEEPQRKSKIRSFDRAFSTSTE